MGISQCLQGVFEFEAEFAGKYSARLQSLQKHLSSILLICLKESYPVIDIFTVPQELQDELLDSNH